MRNISQTSGDEDAGSSQKGPEIPDAPLLPDLKRRLPKSKDPAPAETEDSRQMGLAYVLPSALAAPVVVLTVLGYWLDNRYHWTPYATLIGALLGAVSGFINMIRIASRMNR